MHDLQLVEHGGAPGIRDEGLLDSALAKPRNKHAYGEDNLFELATAYASGLARILAGSLDWEHRDPFDRMIAATAIEMAVPLISKTLYSTASKGRIAGWGVSGLDQIKLTSSPA